MKINSINTINLNNKFNKSQITFRNSNNETVLTPIAADTTQFKRNSVPVGAAKKMNFFKTVADKVNKVLDAKVNQNNYLSSMSFDQLAYITMNKL